MAMNSDVVVTYSLAVLAALQMASALAFASVVAFPTKRALRLGDVLVKAAIINLIFGALIFALMLYVEASR